MRQSRPKAAGRANAAKPRRYVLDEQVGFLMRVAVQRHTTIFVSRMVDGLTQPQFAAIAKLLDIGSCSQNQLGRLIYLDVATIKGVVDRLQVRGFVTTEKDPGDGRRLTVALTETGRRVAKAAVAVAAKITAETLTPLTPSQQRTVIRLLKKLG
jgi:DNA-binding MarR family transcriptional regulator